MAQRNALIWFRQDLRLKDNPALIHAVENGYNVIPVYILDDVNAGNWKLGSAKRWWLYKSLQSLNSSLDNNLVFRSGDAKTIIPELIEQSCATAVFWNRCYEPWRIFRDTQIKSWLKEEEIEYETFNASLLWEPWEISKDDGTPYKVFTPFYRKGCLKHSQPSKPAPRPQNIKFTDFSPRNSEKDLDLLPKIQWYKNLEPYWEYGEDGAQKRLHDFLEGGLKRYKEDRNRPDMNNVSRLSPYLNSGEISPRDVWHSAQNYAEKENVSTNDIDHFCSELGWREFSYSLLYFNKNLMSEPLQPKFKNFPWREDHDDLKAWQNGLTGIPIVDAGMRQLYKTGWMHNRVRMVVGSVLIKNMLLHWQHGEEWFWDCLVDSDLASNAASWQWVAGCGTDAAPYFRIFNPITQGEKFDPQGDYVREFIPELANMPKQYIHKPWEAGPLILKESGVKLGQNYPNPRVNLKETRQRALDAFQSLKKAD